MDLPSRIAPAALPGWERGALGPAPVQNGLNRSTRDWAAGVAWTRLMSPRPP